jgi:hypothetical protein
MLKTDRDNINCFRFEGVRDREVKTVKKKILFVAFAFLFVAMLVAPLVGAAQAKRTKEPYYVDYVMRTISPPTVQKEVGVVGIARGTVLQGPYDGPLGEGTMTAELILTKSTKDEKAVTIFKNTLEITSGPYGAFTLTGLTHYKYNEDGFVSGKTVLQGKSEGGQVTIVAEKGFKPPPKPIWEEGWIIVP